MTLAARNAVLVAGLLVSLILLILWAFAGWALLFGPLADAGITVAESHRWLGMQWTVTRTDVLYSMGAAGVLVLGAVITLAASSRLFRRVSSAELYFVMLFLMFLSPELARLARPLVGALDMPAYMGVQITRVVLFGRLMGALALFVAGIYSAGADYPRIGGATLLLAAISFLVVYLVPVDSHRMNATFVHVTGGGEAIDLMLAFLAVGTIVNCLIGWTRGYRERSGAIAMSIIVLVIGKELVLNVPMAGVQTIGVGLVLAGTVGYVLVSRANYLWY